MILFAAGLAAVVVAAFLRHLQRWSISPPLIGLIVGVVLGPEVVGALVIPADEHVAVMKVATRLLLAVALMAIGLRYPVSRMRPRVGEVATLLLLVLPVMAAVLAFGAVWALQLPVGVALVLGTALSPTDPVLASGIVTGKLAERAIPDRGRQVLSLESGANDGLAMPLLTVALALVLGHSMAGEIGKAVYEVVAGIVLGAVAGATAGRALTWAREHREVGASVRALYTLVLAGMTLGLSGLLNADGLLSVFVAGLVHNRVVTGGDREVEVSLDESLNHLLVIPVFILLGVVLPWSDWAALGRGGVLFVLVALLLRRLPVVLVLRRPLRATWAHVTWLGWFGPIGVAAVFYLAHADERGLANPAVWAAGTLVVAVSTLVHGLTAGPARSAYARWRQ